MYYSFRIYFIPKLSFLLNGKYEKALSSTHEAGMCIEGEGRSC